MSSSAVKQVIQTGTSGEIKVAESDALKIAQINFEDSQFSEITSSQISVQYVGNVFNSDITLTSDVPTYFVRLFGR